jgi:hypothetical protein
LSLAERITRCIVRGFIAWPFLYGGINCWGRVRDMVPGYGERDDMIRDAWALLVVGGIILFGAVRALRRREE